ncbi:MAG: NAD-dependent protein deacetylase, SIR2 family [Anaerostipes sp.]|nr:NAD-dependent protein deacetylase, SIR2 family [Anaerostipes sp.]
MSIDFLYHIPREKVKLSQLEDDLNNRKIQETVQLLSDADAILIGGGSGLSSACGYDYYHNNGFFEQYFSDYRERYGFDTLYSGLSYVYSTPEEQWDFISYYIQLMEREHSGKAYQQLKDLVSDKEYFILTTNVDSQFSKIFPKEKIWAFQGDVRYFQCVQPCHDQVYDNKITVRKLRKHVKNNAVPSEMIPRCPYCGRQMKMWIREEGFLEGAMWEQQKELYYQFLIQNRDKRLVLLELGVGDMTPSIIKFPFWEMTQYQKNVSLISINSGETSAPEHIKEKTLQIPMDIELVFTKIGDLG